MYKASEASGGMEETSRKMAQHYEKSYGYSGGNAFGPVRLVVENQTSKWVKSVNKIILGE